MSDVALRIEQLVGHLAVQKIDELLEEKFNEGILYEEMRVATRHFLGSDAYKGILEAHLAGFLESGLLESIVRDRVQAEVNRLSAELLQSAITEAINSTEVQNAVSERLSQVLTELLQSEPVKTRLAREAKDAVETCMRALTSQIMHGFNDRMTQSASPSP